MDELRLQLRDGTGIHVRRLLPTDADRLQDGVAGLSEETRIQRFHAGLSRLSASQLRYLTEVDQVSHLAWGAEDPDKPDEPGVAVVRAIALPGDPGAAEFAVTVTDRYQGRGLGTLLIGLIAYDAHKRGFERLVGTVRMANEPMLGLLERFGAVTHPSEDGSPTMEITIDVADLASWPESKGVRAIRAAIADWPVPHEGDPPADA